LDNGCGAAPRGGNQNVTASADTMRGFGGASEECASSLRIARHLYFFFVGGGGGASGIGAVPCSCTITQSLPRFSCTSVLRPSPFITSPVFGVISNAEVKVAQ